MIFFTQKLLVLPTIVFPFSLPRPLELLLFTVPDKGEYAVTLTAVLERDISVALSAKLGFDLVGGQATSWNLLLSRGVLVFCSLVL